MQVGFSSLTLGARSYVSKLVAVFRKTRKPIVFSNGVCVPADTIVVAASRDIHMDPEHYENPDSFDALRSYRKRSDGVSGTEGEMYSSYSPTYLHFGIGKHAW